MSFSGDFEGGTGNIVPQIQSGESTTRIIDNIFQIQRFNEAARDLPDFREATNFNLEALGQSSIDISKALQENIQIREEQRAETFSAINALSNFIAETNQRLSRQATELGESVTDASDAAREAGESNFFDDVKNTLGTTGLIIGAGLIALAALK